MSSSDNDAGLSSTSLMCGDTATTRGTLKYNSLRLVSCSSHALVYSYMYCFKENNIKKLVRILTVTFAENIHNWLNGCYWTVYRKSRLFHWQSALYQIFQNHVNNIKRYLQGDTEASELFATADKKVNISQATAMIHLRCSWGEIYNDKSDAN